MFYFNVNNKRILPPKKIPAIVLAVYFMDSISAFTLIGMFVLKAIIVYLVK